MHSISLHICICCNFDFHTLCRWLWWKSKYKSIYQIDLFCFALVDYNNIISAKWMFLDCHLFIYTALKLVSAIFYQFFIFDFKNYKKSFLYHLKISFHSRDIQICVFQSSPLVLPFSHFFGGCLKINLRVYDVINYLNKNLLTHFVWYLEKKKGMTLKLFPLIEY